MAEFSETLDPSQTYGLLQALTTPIVALTCRRGEKLNGMIANSAIRASLVPGSQNVANYVFKPHLTHEILVETGRYVLHIMSRDQWDEIWALGFQSGRDAEKLEGLEYGLTEETGVPILTRCFAWMECEILNVMDAGPSTFFMGRILRAGHGSGREMMDSHHFRTHMPPDWRQVYLDRLAEAQGMAAKMQGDLDDRPWRELRAGSRS